MGQSRGLRTVLFTFLAATDKQPCHPDHNSVIPTGDSRSAKERESEWRDLLLCTNPANADPRINHH
jgi:hypothetical protein